MSISDSWITNTGGRVCSLKRIICIFLNFIMQEDFIIFSNIYSVTIISSCKIESHKIVLSFRTQSFSMLSCLTNFLAEQNVFLPPHVSPHHCHINVTHSNHLLSKNITFEKHLTCTTKHVGLRIIKYFIQSSSQAFVH